MRVSLHSPVFRLVHSIAGVSVLLATSWATGTTPAVKADRVVIVKSTHTLTLLSHGHVLKTYKVSLGRGGSGAKSAAGDRETPEGEYVIDSKNPHSRFHRALHISYPNARDRERARKQGTTPGGNIEIHGIEEKWAWVGSLHLAVDWTAGCIAVTNPEIEEIYELVPVGNARRNPGGRETHRAHRLRRAKDRKPAGVDSGPGGEVRPPLPIAALGAVGRPGGTIPERVRSRQVLWFSGALVGRGEFFP